MKYTVTIVNGDNTITKTADYNTPLFSVLERTGFTRHIHSECGGKGVCGKCLVHASGRLNPISAEERSFIGDELADSGYRLACCCFIKGDCTITIENKSTVNYQEEKTDRYGFAMDIGSARINIVLCNITTQAEMDIVSFDNPQLEIAREVNDRISYWNKGADYAAQLRSILLDRLNSNMTMLIKKHGVSAECIEELCIVGNTCMLHMLANIDPTPLASPDAPCITDNLVLKAKEIGFTEFKNTQVSICGAISGKVGSNIVASALTTGVYKSNLPVLIINIGSTIEVLMGNRNILLACDPVPNPLSFDTALDCGAFPESGVILRLWKDKYKVCYKMENDVPPRALCISAAFDALEIMLDVGIIDADGNMMDASVLKPSKLRMIGNVNGEQVFFIDKKHHLYLTQRDIRLLQQVKASILCNIQYLLEQFDIHFADELSAVYLCNVLGGMMDVKTAVNIGMYPELIKDVCFGIGNASLQGASMLIKSPRARANAEHIRTYTRVLPKDPLYQQRYTEALKLEKK